MAEHKANKSLRNMFDLYIKLSLTAYKDRFGDIWLHNSIQYYSWLDNDSEATSKRRQKYFVLFYNSFLQFFKNC